VRLFRVNAAKLAIYIVTTKFAAAQAPEKGQINPSEHASGEEF